MIPLDYLETGKQKEIEFAECYCRYANIKQSFVEQSSREDDIYRHIDIWINSIGWDVKAAKKVNRYDNTPDYSIHWLEFKNVNGKKGWLYGDADYIAFELENCWLSVPRIQLIHDLLIKMGTPTFIQNRESFYTLYNRYGRKDLITKVHSEFLKSIKGTVVVPKLV